MNDQLAILGGTKVRKNPFPIESPSIGEEEIAAVVDVLRDKTLSIFSSTKISEFESAFAKYIGTDYAIAVTSGTAALHTALLAVGVKSGDEVIVPVYTHMSTINSVLMIGARPVFVDIDPETFNINIDQIRELITSKTKAVIIVDLFGQPVDRKAISKILDGSGVFLIEDCAQSTGASFNNKKVGSFGVGCHSFGEIKNITTAEGGMVTTNDANIARLARLIRHEGEMWKSTNASVINSSPTNYKEMIYGIDYPVVGHNYRMNSLQASMGLVQLEKLDRLNGKRIDVAKYYISELEEYPYFLLPRSDQNFTHVYNRFVFRLKKDIEISRDAFLAALISEGIPAGVYYPVPLNHHQFSSEEKHYVGAETACADQIVLPSYPALGDEEKKDVVVAIKKIISIVLKDTNIIPQLENISQEIKATYFGQFFSIGKREML